MVFGRNYKNKKLKNSFATTKKTKNSKTNQYRDQAFREVNVPYILHCTEQRIIFSFLQKDLFKDSTQFATLIFNCSRKKHFFGLTFMFDTH